MSDFGSIRKRFEKFMYTVVLPAAINVLRNKEDFFGKSV